jgi:hypothetical protein
MQLNLFEDNRKGILLHIADTLIRALDLVQAVSVYEQLVADYPEDGHIASLLKSVSEWNDLLAGIKNTTDDLGVCRTFRLL